MPISVNAVRVCAGIEMMLGLAGEFGVAGSSRVWYNSNVSISRN